MDNGADGISFSLNRHIYVTGNICHTGIVFIRTRN